MTTQESGAPADLIQHNHRTFERAVERARASLAAGDLTAAAVLAGVASNTATWMHPGLFASGELERLTIEIGRQAAGSPPRPPRRRGERVERVLHVFTRTLAIGGHTRMVWRWMGLDGGRQHSVAVTRQGGRPVPADLIAGAAATGGRVTVLGESGGDVVSWARELHDLATGADVVILHIDPEDVIPVVAFADRSDLPPVLYLNHADHLFWLGVGSADLVVNLRRSGHELSPARRGVPLERNAFIPIALGERQRTMSRAEAKRHLGLPEDTVLLVTVARAAKFDYETSTGESYIDAVLPVVQAHERVRLIVVGAEQEGQFARGHDATGGRISALGVRTDNEELYQAADVYLDSYPQPSPTSLLEAGSYGVALLALCDDPTEWSVLSADAPGIDEGLVRARSIEEFRRHLDDLITDPTRREELGDRTRSDIERLHLGDGWLDQLEDLYRLALTTPPLLDPPPIGDVPHHGDPDAAIARANPQVDDDDVLAYHLRLLPWRPRVTAWVRAWRHGRRLSPSMLLGESTTAKLRRIRSRAGR